ncbi:MAG: ASCH domain-containing protein [Planctomycetota bacterium]|nr:MAG: ASCH domain-containing protein [Planctomycetota bacterium]
MNHLAIVRRPYLDLILAGEKTIESRLTKVRCAPYGRVAPGDVIFFKEPSGPVRARARAGRIREEAGLTPASVERLRRSLNGRILGERGYWDEKREARYACLIWLDTVAPTHDWPATPKMNGRGWLCLGPGEPPRAVRGRTRCAT